MQNGKDTIYVDIDDEITAIIDKVTGSKQKIVALVLPKRATVFQSIVNMKLLKRSAESANKNVVLITSETGLLPLAGTVGLHVAKTPQSKPEIPVVPAVTRYDDESIEGEALTLDDQPETEFTAENAGNRTVGELAGAATASGVTAAAAPKSVEALSLDDAAGMASGHAKKGKDKTKKVPKIPNFSTFRKRVALGVLALIALGAGLYVCAFILPRATIAISTDATDYNSGFDLTLDTAADKVDTAELVAPATLVQQQKTYTAQSPATGQQDNGTRATGSVQLTNCSAPNESIRVPAGTAVSVNGLNYITQSDAYLGFSSKQGSKCTPQAFSSDTVGVTAQQNGDKYNIDDGTKLAVAGHSDVVAAADGDIDGGTSKIVTVVSQKDINDAKAKIASENTDAIKSALSQQLKQTNMYPVTASFTAGTPNVTTTSQPGDEASAVTVTQSVTYTMFGAKRDYLDQLIKEDIKQQIDTETQSILDDGLSKANFSLVSNTDTTAKLNLKTTARVGPKIDSKNLTEEVKGKKSGYVKSLIGNQTGVTDVNVKLSPFWVSSVPNDSSKITITVDKTSAENDTN